MLIILNFGGVLFNLIMCNFWLGISVFGMKLYKLVLCIVLIVVEKVGKDIKIFLGWFFVLN